MVLGIVRFFHPFDALLRFFHEAQIIFKRFLELIEAVRNKLGGPAFDEFNNVLAVRVKEYCRVKLRVTIRHRYLWFGFALFGRHDLAYFYLTAHNISKDAEPLLRHRRKCNLVWLSSLFVVHDQSPFAGYSGPPLCFATDTLRLFASAKQVRRRHCAAVASMMRYTAPAAALPFRPFRDRPPLVPSMLLTADGE